MTEEKFQKNVLGEKLEACSIDPLTGWFRDGCCNTNETDLGLHTLYVMRLVGYKSYVIAF